MGMMLSMVFSLFFSFGRFLKSSWQGAGESSFGAPDFSSGRERGLTLTRQLAEWIL
jgi:hypothetical protein